MALLGELGCFAYYFNSIAWFAASGALRFSHDPVLSAILLLVTSLQAVLASKLLLKTIDIHFSGQSSKGQPTAPDPIPQEIARPRAPEQRRTALNLPFLLRSCQGDKWYSSIPYLFFLGAMSIALLRTSVTFGLKSYTLLVDHADLNGDLAIGVVVALFICAASSTAFPSYQSHQVFQIACIFLNVFYAFSKVTSEGYVKIRQTPTTGSVFPHFVSFLSIDLIIPSVLAVSKVSPQRHGVLVAWAVGIVAVLYVAFVGLIQLGISVEIPLWVRAAVALPCLFASCHIRMGAIVDVVIAWRYGLNVKVAQQHYPQRVQAVRVLLPFAFYAFCFSFSYYKFPLAESLDHWVFGALFTVSLALIAIFYCHWATQVLFKAEDSGWESWWKYGVLAGGVGCVAITVYFFRYNEQFNKWDSFITDGCILGVFALWHLIGQFFG